jgi:general stress protein 26
VRTHDFEEIREDFLDRVHRMIFCAATTIDSQGRPRSRILHPIWDGNTGWISTDPRSLKARHLKDRPYMSLAYINDSAKPVYVDCVASFSEDPAEKQRAWNLYLNAEPPLGFDPAQVYGSIDQPNPGGPVFGALKLAPYRILLYQFPVPSTIWTPEPGQAPTAND